MKWTKSHNYYKQLIKSSFAGSACTGRYLLWGFHRTHTFIVPSVWKFAFSRSHMIFSILLYMWYLCNCSMHLCIHIHLYHVYVVYNIYLESKKLVTLWYNELQSQSTKAQSVNHHNKTSYTHRLLPKKANIQNHWNLDNNNGETDYY